MALSGFVAVHLNLWLTCKMTVDQPRRYRAVFKNGGMDCLEFIERSEQRLQWALRC